uniref:DNA polymerase zeta catalytic subunit n=1 Tax=Anthurium amnicola TaxID=1678845 RepID=A0A1D1Y8K7_9ARAE
MSSPPQPSPPSSVSSPVFSIRIVSLDYYMAAPIPGLDFCDSPCFPGRRVEEVPVIRIYGSTLAGQKACLHVHGALPYLYIPCSELQTSKEGQTYILETSSAVEKALQFKGTYGRKRQHVHECSFVRAKKFYGYHSTEELFVKIYLYHPTDVARAAALLLGGSILNKSVQPYESHIPFLLQFMVDYNLYGMSHLHTSKVKFRHPLPDKFIPRAARYDDQTGPIIEKITSVSVGRQADLSPEVTGNPPFWLSSTVPSDWTWSTLAAYDDALDDKSTCCTKRQSICELEGDSSIDDILNQKAKIYLSLSQTNSDMKMVQSLLPIWEEKYERSGVHEFIRSPDISKPLPETVLRSFFDRFEYENALSNIFIEAQKNLSCKYSLFEDNKKFEEHIKSITDTGNFVTPTQGQKLGNSTEEMLLHLEEKRNISATSGWPSHVECGLAQDRTHAFLGSSSNSEINISSTERKAADVEALGLLSWLASSQAAEDVSFDDELIHEAILSPLLPSKNYDKVLEKAHLDYEIESQQECQDILDSLEDFQFDDLKEKPASASDHDCSVSAPLVNVIPQVDGSSDDQISFSQISKASDIKMRGKLEMSPSNISGKPVAGRSGKKGKRNHLSWGPLPFAIKKRVSEVSCSPNVDSDDFPPDEIENITDASSSCESEAGESCKPSETESSPQITIMGDGRRTTSSVRDLMRWKRCYRAEQFERGGEMAAENECNTVLHMEKLNSQSHNSDDSSLMPSVSHHDNSYFPQRHGLLACQEEMTCSTRSADEPSDVFQPAEWFSPLKSKLSFTPSADICLQADALKVQLDSHEAPSKRECLFASVGSLDMADNNMLQSDDSLNMIPGSIHSRQLPPAMCSVLPECSRDRYHSHSTSTGHGMNRFQSSKQDSFLGSLQLKCGSADYKFSEMVQKGVEAIDSKTLTTNAVEGITFPENCGSNTDECHKASKNFSNVQPNKVIKANSALDLKALPIDDSIHVRCDRRICNSCTALKRDKTPVGFVEMTYIQKPPIIEKKSDFLEGSQLPVAGLIENMKSSYFSDHELQGPDFPPFFRSDEREEGDHKSFLTRGGSEAVWGIPIHFQNDGSFTYLLTFAVSPPSLCSVNQWLLQNTDLNILEQPFEHSSEIGDCSVNISEIHHCYSHDVQTSMFPDVPKSASAQKDSREFARNPVPRNLKKSIDHSSNEDDASAISEGTLNSEVIKTSKPHGAGIDMQNKKSTTSYCDISQISGPSEKSKLTPLSQIGFRDPASAGGGQSLTLLSMEIQAESRGNLQPDPQFDAINLIALVIQEDTASNPKFYVLLRGADVKSYGRSVDGIFACTFQIFPEERCLFDHLVKIIALFDPDILLGWEIQGSSLGFLAERAAHLGIHLLKDISRIPAVETKREAKTFASPDKEVSDKLSSETMINSIVLEDEIIEDEWGRTHASGIHVGGRIVLNIWRLMRSELKLRMYTIEAVALEVLRRKIPCIPFRTLNDWFSSGSHSARFRCIEYVLDRANLNLQIMNQLDMINRTSELARVFGIDFFSVLSRGSQFRVESMLLRLAHTQNYLAISPGNQQVASQPAMECLPLVMEPESGFYADPVVVLDFQSLYPSMMIAYNLCYSTCLGKVLPSRADVLGVSSFPPDSHLLIDLKEQMLLSPNGVMYVPAKVRRGVLPHLLDEILSTRIMVKKEMKKLMPSQQVLHRVFNARQLALKLIANVTYGYTAAGFSGRMPCAELADSIVQCGRKTLEKAISFVNSHNTWNARVIYGDTDSMFVLLRGRSVEEAFEIGNEIASAITSMNPNPVTLKMEKVYYPCFLLTKKRYVGYSYENPNQEKPLFDDKGIETVRRDTCPAVAKTLEKTLRLFFEHRDITEVKVYLQRQWTKILSGKVSLQDFVFAKEVRLGTYSSRATSLPPAAIVATKAMKVDHRSEPRYGERIPYVVIHGEPGARLVDMVIDPLELLEINSPYRLNDVYYIKKQIIPALQRAFGLLGVDLNQWFSEIPRPVRSTVAKRHSCESSSMSAVYRSDNIEEMAKKVHTRNRIDKYYLSKHCAVCGHLVQASAYLCDSCFNKGPLVATILGGRTSKLEREIHHLSAICRHCGGGDWIIEKGVKCTSLACSVFYERRKVQKELRSLSAVATEAGFYPRCVSEWF